MARISREQMFMDIAEIVAKRSACLRNNVGAVIVNKDNNIVSIGYNGPAAGVPHCTKEICHKGCDIAIHAEDNSIKRMPDRELYGPEDCLQFKPYSLYVTVSPCINCAKLIVDRKDIVKVYYRYEYRDRSGIIYLLSQGIKVYRILTGGIINEEQL